MADVLVLAAIALVWLSLLYALTARVWRSMVLRRAACRILPVAPMSTQPPTPLQQGPLENRRQLVVPAYVGPCSMCGAEAGRGCWHFCPDRHERF